MRVNVDSAIFGDGRLKKLAKVLGVPWTQALGCLVAAWHHSYQARCAVVLAEDIDLMADVDGLAAAMVQSGLAAIVGKGKVRISGVTERIEWLEKQAERSTKGVEARRSRVNQAVDQVVNPTVNQTVNPVGQPDGQPNSLLFSGSNSTSSLKEEASPVGAATARVARAKREVTSAAADLAAYFAEAILTHKPDARLPPPGTTALEFDVGLRAGVTVERFKAAIDYAHRSEAGSFWRPNVLSAAKLRAKLDTLEIQMLGNGKARPPPRQQTLQEAGIRTFDEMEQQRKSAQQGEP